MIPLLYTQDFTPHKPSQKLQFKGNWDIEVKEGDRVCIYGESGSGKSVFLKSLTLLFPPESGSVYFQGQQVTNKDVLYYRSNVIYLQQVPQFGDDTIAEEFNRVFRFKIYKNNQAQLWEMAHRFVEIFGLEQDVFTCKAYELSGGQKQKIHLALGLCLDPHILILDEPTSSLDDKNTFGIEQLMQDWVLETKKKRAYLWVSHQPAQRKRVGKKFFHVIGGRLLASEAYEADYSSISS